MEKFVINLKEGTLILREQKVSDAIHYFQILNNPEILHFTIKPKSIEAEMQWISENLKKKNQGTEYHFTIECEAQVVGNIGVKRKLNEPRLGEVGFFIDPKQWNKGIASKALEVMEKLCKSELGFEKLQLVIMIENIASERVAIKREFTKLGLFKSYLMDKNNQLRDCFIYEKTLV